MGGITSKVLTERWHLTWAFNKAQSHSAIRLRHQHCQGIVSRRPPAETILLRKTRRTHVDLLLAIPSFSQHSIPSQASVTFPQNNVLFFF